MSDLQRRAGRHRWRTTAPRYVYAIGRIEPRLPRLSVEKEFAQAIGRTETGKLTDRQAMHKGLSRRENRYLARQMCWVMSIEGLETYILVPGDPVDLDLLVESVRATPSPMDLDVVIGRSGPMAPPDMCNGLLVPIVFFSNLYSFDRDALLRGIPCPPKTEAKDFAPVAEEVFDRIMQLADNHGMQDRDRT